MKIAYLFSRYPVPSQTFCDTEIRALEAAGHEIEIYSCSAPTTSFRHGGPAEWPRAEVLYAPPAPVLEAWADAARQEGTWPGEMVADHEARFGTRYDPARRARHALYFADRLRRRGVEHVHVHFANRATHAALFLHALTGLPFSFTAHAQDFLVDLGHDDLLRLMCAQAAFVVAVSDWSRRALVERCPAAADKIHRIHNGLDLARWPLTQTSPPPPALPPDGRLRMFSVGRLIEFKGFLDLLAACRLLVERGVRFSCEIAGDGPLRGVLEQQAATFSQPDATVKIVGLLSQDQVRSRLEESDVFVLASRVDAKGACDVLPTVILEAMALAKPVVSTRLAAIPEMVDDARTGLLVPPGAPGLLADVLAELAKLPEEWRRMGRAGYDRVSTDFSAARSAEQLGALFARTRKTGSFIPGNLSRTQTSGSVFCLFDRWPLEQSFSQPSAFDGARLASFLERTGANLLALKPGEFESGSGLDPSPSTLNSPAEIEYLPDDILFETFWRKEAAAAHRLESWRTDVGGACPAEKFLLACRRALYLQHRLRAGNARPCHLHAVGSQALLCVWLLRRLAGVVTTSFLLLPGEARVNGLAGSTLRKLAPEFAGGWVAGEHKLALSLGPGFRGDTFASAAWIDAVETFARSSPRER